MVLPICIALAGIFVLMLVWRRHLGSLMQVASLLAALLLMIWLQDNGYLGSTSHQPPSDIGFVPRSSPNR